MGGMGLSSSESAVPQEAHPPVGTVGNMIDCSAQTGAPQYRGSGRRRVLGAGVQNRTGGELVQDDRLLRGRCGNGGP
ncbi:hypothetical protein Emag_003593 [Eimeria magna]